MSGAPIGGLIPDAAIPRANRMLRPGDYLDAEGLARCGRCNGRREVVVPLLPGRPPFRVPCMCRCEAEEYDRANPARMASLKTLGTLPSGLALPDIDKLTFDLAERKIGREHVAKARRYAERFDEMMRDDVGLLLFGPPSCGNYAGERIMLRNGLPPQVMRSRQPRPFA